MENTYRSRLLLSMAVALTLVLGACSTISKNPLDSTRKKIDTATLQIVAGQFGGLLRQQASYGTSTDPEDTDARRPTLFLGLMEFSDWGVATAGTSLASDQPRILMWQGAGQASVKWTRISCPSGDCSSINPDDGTLVSAVGENSKLYNPEPRTSICLQFHLADQNLWMNVTSSAEPNVVADVLETACPASVFPGITAATGTTYADLSATPGEALVDPTW